jgi:hypothetical protein
LDAITHRTDLKKIAEHLEHNNALSIEEQVRYIHLKVLKKKVRFPLLGYFAEELFAMIPPDRQVEFSDRIVELDEIGSYTIAGKLLQLRLKKNLTQSFKKAEEYIKKAGKWYACDIIGERVFGHGLLLWPEKTLPFLRKLAKHDDKWMVRSVGVAAHYAIKKGLPKKQVETLFLILLGLSGTTELHTKKGIGWAAKTTAKFYPDLIQKYEKEIYSGAEVKQWFKTKIKIGLGRSFKYAAKYHS